MSVHVPKTTAEALDHMVGAYDEVHTLDNRLMHEWYPERVITMATGSSLLELGLGHGHSTTCFSRHFSRYKSIEGSQQMIERFRRRWDLPNFEIELGYFETFETEERFDHIGMGFVLEHVDDPGLILRRFARFLKPGGTTFVAVPNCESLHRRIGHAAGLLPDMTVLSEGDRKFGHQRYYSVATLSEEIRRCGYRIVATEGIFLKPVTTGQLEGLNLSEALLRGLMCVGVDYPELCNAILMQITPEL